MKKEVDKNYVTLRKATERDIDILVQYRIQFLTESYGAAPVEEETALRSGLSEYFKRAFIERCFISWIAEYDNKPVGFSGMVVREQPGNFDIPYGKTGYILNMFTLKEYRNMGICKSLFSKLIDEARALKLDKIELHATSDGEPVYRQFGFTEPADKAMELKLRY